MIIRHQRSLRILGLALFLISLPIGKGIGGFEAASTIFFPIIMDQREIIYASSNLSGHAIFGECNPGGDNSCICDKELDASIRSYASYGEVTSNPRQRNTYVNAIGYKKFVEIFPDGTPVRLGKYHYLGEFRLPTLPALDVNQIVNAQAIHLMIQLWDGRNELYPADEYSLEGAIYWVLNPWEDDYGKIMVYTGSLKGLSELELQDTGILLAPDTDWHQFELIVDLDNQTYISVSIDGDERILENIELAKVHQPTWGDDISLSITTESMATWPQLTCSYVFTWTTYFRNLEFSAIQN